MRVEAENVTPAGKTPTFEYVMEAPMVGVGAMVNAGITQLAVAA